MIGWQQINKGRSSWYVHVCRMDDVIITFNSSRLRIPKLRTRIRSLAMGYLLLTLWLAYFSAPISQTCTLVSLRALRLA